MIPQLICIASVCSWVSSWPDFDRIKGQRQTMESNQELNLANECEAMNAEGKIQSLLQKISADAEKIAKVRTDRGRPRDLEMLQELRESLRQNVTKAKSILRPEWTESKWPYRARWIFRFTDVMNVHPSIIEQNFSFRDFEITSVELGGIEREDLYPLLKVEIGQQEMEITLQKNASSLELCQLQSSLSISGKITIRFQDRNSQRDTEMTLKPGVFQESLFPDLDINFPPPRAPSPSDLLPNREPDWNKICEYLKNCPNFPLPGVPSPFPVPKGVHP